ncbi:MAG: protein kinase [Myxococcaceae bacterium]|nr:protein kinase [Myxococcaceae bacterium]
MNAGECPSPDQLLTPQGLAPDILSHVSRCEGCQAAVAAVSTSPEEPRDTLVLAERYRLEERVGTGAHGEVWRATDITLGRPVAVKLLCGKSTDQLSAIVRLLREARVLARLNDPHVVRVYDGGMHQGQPYLVTEWLAGGDLVRWLAASHRNWRGVVTLFTQAASGLAAAHRHGVIHRDFKPSNLVLDEASTPRVADFGLSRFEADVSFADVLDTPIDLTITRSGHVAGTPAYLAPEQLRGEVATPLSDQYSFFVSLYEALEGARPSDASAAGFSSRTPRTLRAVISRGLEREPARRWRDLEQARHALFNAMQAPARRLKWLGAVVALMFITAAAVLVPRWQRRASCQSLDSNLRWTEVERQALFTKLPLTFPGSEQALFAARERLQKFEDTWHSELETACLANATSPSPRWPAQHECFRRQMLQAKTLSQHFTVRKAEQLPLLIEAIAELPQPEECRETPARAPRPGEFESLKIKGLDIGQLDALKTTHDYAHAKTEADTIAHHAREHGFPELEAEALLYSNTASYYLGDETQSLAAMSSLLPKAEALGLDHLRFQTMLQLAFLMGARFDRADEAQLLMAQADALATRIGIAPREQAELAYTRGVLRFHRGDRTGAIKSHEQALALLTERGEQQSPLAIHVLRVMAQAHLWEHRSAIALTQYQQANAIAVATLGKQSLIYASTLNDYGTALADNGRLADAQAALKEAVALNAPQSPNQLITRNHLAWLEGEIGNLTKAQSDLEQLLADYQQLFPDRPWQTVGVLRGLAQLALARGDTAQALSHAKRMIEVAPASGPRRLSALCRGGFVYLATNHRAEALEAFAMAPPSPANEDSPERWCLDTGRLLARDKAMNAEELLPRMSAADTQAAALYQAAVHFALARSALQSRKPESAATLAEQGKQVLTGRIGRRVEAYQRALDLLKAGQLAEIPAVVP